MNRDSLLERKAVIEKEFTEFDTEMKRLQGEHRLIVTLLEKAEAQEIIPRKTSRIRKVTDAPSN